ncbi:MAG: arginine N-succinyltransferase, partial [Burkholderia sp.]|nr:arginine N-succinyltransferase [Burkholderia sp.]
HLISRARMMYIAANRRRFTPEVFTLLLGVSDGNGASPFWEAVGRKFFGRDFTDVDIASGGRSRTFIAEVMPAYPLYVPLLPEAAQRVLGEPNETALLAYDIHLEEGFEPDRFVDIFDAGPVLTAQVDRTACVKQASERVVREAAHQQGDVAYMVSTGSGESFRCVLADLPGDTADAPLAGDVRAALDVKDGDVVRCVPLHRRDDEDLKGDAA